MICTKNPSLHKLQQRLETQNLPDSMVSFRCSIDLKENTSKSLLKLLDIRKMKTHNITAVQHSNIVVQV